MIGSFLMGLGLAVLVNLKHLKKKKEDKVFVCGHCESKDTLQIQKLRERNVFTCSFCERIVDETLLKFNHKEDYEAITKDPEAYEAARKARKEATKK